jgi:hypothetical protein
MIRFRCLAIGLVFSCSLFPGVSRAQKLERAYLAFGSSGGNLTAFWVAREAGLYRQYGLDVDVVFLRGSTTQVLSAPSTTANIQRNSAVKKTFLCSKDARSSARCATRTFFGSGRVTSFPT